MNARDTPPEDMHPSSATLLSLLFGPVALVSNLVVPLLAPPEWQAFPRILLVPAMLFGMAAGWMEYDRAKDYAKLAFPRKRP